MTKSSIYYLITVLFIILSKGIYPEYITAVNAYSIITRQNPSDKQLLLNGRIWRNQYSKAFGDQYFLTNTYLKGSVTLDGKRFDNINMKYDIANDELIISIEPFPVIFVNKELVDSFSLEYGNRRYSIINTGADNKSVLKGYINVLYNGPTSLYVKYIKKVQPMAVDGRYDLLVQEHNVFLKKGTGFISVKGKRQLLKQLAEKKGEIRHYLKSNRLRVNFKDPDTFIPVLEFYDSLMNR